LRERRAGCGASRNMRRYDIKFNIVPLFFCVSSYAFRYIFHNIISEAIVIIVARTHNQAGDNLKHNGNHFLLDLLPLPSLLGIS
jgi:hypothetical protein